MSLTKNVMSRNIGIEKDIPLPKYTKMSKKDDLIGDLQKMKVEESRVINVNYSPETLNSTRVKIYGILKNPDNKLEGKKFTVNIDPVSNSLLRIWRTV